MTTPAAVGTEGRGTKPRRRRPPFLLGALAGVVVAAMALPLIYLAIRSLEGGWEPVAEVVFVILLCHAVLSARQVGLAMGLRVPAGGYALGATSGGSLSPAVSSRVRPGPARAPINRDFTKATAMGMLCSSCFDALGAATARRRQRRRHPRPRPRPIVGAPFTGTLGDRPVEDCAADTMQT